MNLVKLILRRLKKIKFLVKIKKKIWHIFYPNINDHPILTKADYFSNLFEQTPNFRSLSFENGLIKGEFKSIEFFIKHKSQDIISSSIYLKKLWEPHIVNLISSFIENSNGSVLDIGANVGAISIPLAKKYQKTNFYLFEAHPEIYEELIINKSYNRLDNIELYNFAISNENTQTTYFYASNNFQNRGLSSLKINHDNIDCKKIQVNCTSIDKFFEKKDIKIDLIKIDTQGTELQVLKSSSQIIKKNKPVIIFEFESEYFPEKQEHEYYKNEILNFFKQESYNLYMIDPKLNYFPELKLNFYFRGEILALPKLYNK